MAKLKYEDVKKEIEDAGWTLLTEVYTNLKTDMHFKCPEGHNNYISLERWRRGHKCLTCENNPLKNVPISPVKKNGFRILALDQASITSGYAIFDEDKLISYGKWSSNGTHSTERISQTKSWIACMIEKWKPDLVVLEDIQLQKFGEDGQEGVLTFKCEVSITDFINMIYRNEEAIKEFLKKDEVLRRIALKEKLLRMDINQAKADAEEYGREKGRAEATKETKEEIVRKMYEIDITVEHIAKVVNLEVSEVKKILNL